MRELFKGLIAGFALLAVAVFGVGFLGGGPSVGLVKQLIEESNVPSGGLTGQYLKKLSNADYDFTWDTPAAGGDMLSTSNLSDVGSVSTSRTNLGLGTGSDVTFNSLTATAGVTVPQGASGQAISLYEASGNGTNKFTLSVPTSMSADIAVEAEDLVAEVITFVIDGNGSAITTGVKGFVEVPYDCLIKRATVLADQSGSIVVDIWKDTYANYPPTDVDSITASAPPTIASAVKSQDSTLTGWTKAVNAGDILGFNVDSASTVTRVTVSLYVEK